ncbi:lactate dehydrogenase [Candidatus Kuenenbacteria bacterium]|nr:lactate dehydrogenase [Candidatus Kuenenbacteria bacterium]
MNVLVTLHPFGEYNNARELLEPFSVNYNEKGKKYNREEQIAQLKKHRPEIIIAGTEKYDKEALDLCPDLKMIARAGVGVDEVDLQECLDRKIVLAYTPDSAVNAVSELVIGQILNALRNVQNIHNKWERYIGRELSDCTVGVIGCGRIGSGVIGKLIGLGVKKVLVSDIDPGKVSQMSNVISASKEEILTNCDVITLHIPLKEPSLNSTYCNKNFIVGSDFTKLKSDAILINTSRGGIVNEDDLLQWLKFNPEAKAIIDTFSEEPYGGEFHDLPNAFTTPHLGSCTIKCRKSMEVGAVEEVLSFIQGKDLKNRLI